MKKLPKIYHNDIDKSLTNNKEVFYSNREEVRFDFEEKSVAEVLNEVFSGMGYSFNVPLIIETTDKIYETSLIAKTKDFLITFDNDSIPLATVRRISIKK